MVSYVARILTIRRTAETILSPAGQRQHVIIFPTTKEVKK
jgi:hypothetical protein